MNKVYDVYSPNIKIMEQIEATRPVAAARKFAESHIKLLMEKGGDIFIPNGSGEFYRYSPYMTTDNLINVSAYLASQEFPFADDFKHYHKKKELLTEMVELKKQLSSLILNLKYANTPNEVDEIETNFSRLTFTAPQG